MKQNHLPKQSQSRKQILDKLKNMLEQLKSFQSQIKYSQQNNEALHKIHTLELRIKLIQTYASDTLTLDRISHLQQIFKHYCTHIFKIGKHMTFERLQYEKIHLTLDRFLMLLKDFGLNSCKFYICPKTGEPQSQYIKYRQKQDRSIDSQSKDREIKQYEIIDKNEIVKVFKRISDNSRDLSFEGFISAVEKLAIKYYDNKQRFVQKQKNKHLERQKRIKQYRERMIKKAKQAKQVQNQNEQNNQKQQKQKMENQFDQNKKNEGKNQNDDLIDNMMADQNLQDPNLQVQKATKSSKINPTNATTSSFAEQFTLTSQQKVQYYYQLFGVDNVHDFRTRMSQLGLPLFKPPKKSSSSKNTKNQVLVTFQQSDKQENLRLIELRSKLQQKRQKQKQMHGPLLTKQEYQQRKKKRQQKQNEQMSESNSKVKNISHIKQRKIDLSDKQISWDFVNHLEYNDLKIKVDLKKLIAVEDEDDHSYLQQYNAHFDNSVKKSEKSIKDSKVKRSRSNIGPNLRQRTLSDMQMGHKRNGSSIISGIKQRAKEMEIQQFNKQAKLSRFLGNARKQQRKFGHNMSRF